LSPSVYPLAPVHGKLVACAVGLGLGLLGCSSDSTKGSGGAGGSSSATSSPDTTSVTTGAGVTTSVTTGTGAGTGGSAPTGTPTFAVAGYNLRRLVSTDGTNWAHDTSDPPSNLDNIGDGIAFGKGIVAVVAHSGLVTSPDGATWTKIGAPLPQAWPGLGGGKVIFDGTQFVIVASSDTYESSDGITWTKYSTMDGATHWNGLQFGNGHYVAVGDSNASGGDKKASEDGQTWHDYVQGGPAIRALSFGNGVFVAVGPAGFIQTTTDGATWADHTNASMGDLGNIAFGNGMFVSCAYPKCHTSPDGVTWTDHDAMNPPDGPMAHGLNLFFSVTWESNILTSSDGINWTKVFSGASGTPALASVGFGNLGP
jgi:hypothetical protein